jgi:hypothetical protein
MGEMKAPCAEMEDESDKNIFAKLGTLLPNKGYCETVEPQAGSGTVLLAEQAGTARLSHHCPFKRTCCNLKTLI